MSRAHLPGLHIDDDGVVRIQTQDDLDRLLACPVRDLSVEMVMFLDQHWLDRSDEERSRTAMFLNSVRAQVCSEGRLPSPRTELAPVGVRVEAIHGGKPNPERRWAVGTVTAHEWCSVSRDWRVGVSFDSPNGSWCGTAIRGTSTFPELVYEIGDPERRPFSAMSQSEIEVIFEGHRQRQE
jgi:hypothetical protein